MDRIFAALLGLGLVAAGAAGADVLETRDGRVLDGTFRGATQQSIRFEVDGRVRVIPVDAARAVKFAAATASNRSAPPPAPITTAAARPEPPPPPASAEPAASRAAALVVTAGTRLRVRIGDTVDPRIGAEGDRFSGVLGSPLMADGVVVVPDGARVYGVVSEARSTGPVASRLKLELTEVMLGGLMIPIVSGTHQVLEMATMDGAELPAKATGTAPSRPDRIPIGSLLEFRLLQPLELQHQ